MTEARKTSIAVLMTCFNRREHTLAALENLRRQQGCEDVELAIFLVDDASTDGTAEAVRAGYPEVSVLSGQGDLYWNRGMRLALEHARRGEYDQYLWLNDDTMLFPDALSRVLAAMRTLEAKGETAIVTGSTCDRSGRTRTYGGARWSGGWRRQLTPVDPDPTALLACDTMNGNCTLLPRRVVETVGNLDPVFHHSFGDLDYGFRARAAGFGIYVAPGYVGSCSDNSREGTWRDRTAPFARRWRHLNSPKGSPFREWTLYCRRHLGWLWPLYAISPYAKTLVTARVRPE